MLKNKFKKHIKIFSATLSLAAILPLVADAHSGFVDFAGKKLPVEMVSIFSPTGLMEMVVYFLFIIFLSIEAKNFLKRKRNNR